MVSTLKGRPIISGQAEGRVLLASRSISFWGGVDPTSGQIIDRRHDRHGESVAGRIFAFPAEKGSSTGSAILLELIRVGRAPAAIVTQHLAPILALGAIVAEELYGLTIPIVQLSEADFERLSDGERVRLFTDGIIQLQD
jgi:predicted aconitase with swiveling domain